MAGSPRMHIIFSNPRHFRGTADLAGWRIVRSAHGFNAYAGSMQVAHYHAATCMLATQWPCSPPSDLPDDTYRLLLHGDPDDLDRHTLTLEWSDRTSRRRRAQVFRTRKDQLIRQLRDRSPGCTIIELQQNR